MVPMQDKWRHHSAPLTMHAWHYKLCQVFRRWRELLITLCVLSDNETCKDTLFNWVSSKAHSLLKNGEQEVIILSGLRHDGKVISFSSCMADLPGEVFTCLYFTHCKKRTKKNKGIMGGDILWSCPLTGLRAALLLSESSTAWLQTEASNYTEALIAVIHWFPMFSQTA